MKKKNKSLKYVSGILAYFFIFTVIVSKSCIDIAESKTPETEYAWTLKRLESLEHVAKQYDERNAEAWMYIYVRCKRYDAMSWRLMAGDVSADFESFVAKHQHWYVEQLQTLDVLALPNGENCDFIHLFAVLNMIERDFSVVGGWGGDLVQLTSSIKDSLGEFPVLLAKAKEKLGKEDSLFNEMDLYADMDAVNLHKRKEHSGADVWEVFDKYYGEITKEQRVLEFLQNTFVGENLSEQVFENLSREELRETVHQSFLEDSWVKALCVNYKINGEEYKEHKRAAAYAFADYCYDACVPK